MNRRLLAGKSLPSRPEVIEEFFEYGFAQCCAFNPPGTLLATGTDDGYIGIWDFLTRGLAKVLPGHTSDEAASSAHPVVTSLAWSRSGHHLLSGAKDKRIILWEVLTGQKVCEVTLPCPVTHVCLSAAQPFIAVVSLASKPPMVVDLASQQATPLLSVDMRPVLQGGSDGQQQYVSFEPQPAFALLSRSGREVFVGQQANKGLISVYDAATQQLLDVVKLPGCVKVLSLSLNQAGTLLLINCSDKALRMADVRERDPEAAPALSKEQVEARLAAVPVGRTGSLLLGELASVVSLSAATFHNAVEKSPWGRAVLSAGRQQGRYVVAAVASRSDCRMYTWIRLTGKLEAILEGPRNEGILDMAWHPASPQLVSVSTNGKVYVWAPRYKEDWSAFAPDFQELEENEEYVEAEDEFDANKRDAPLAPPHDSDAEDEAVDVLTRERLPLPPASSSDAEDEGEAGRVGPAGDDGSEAPLLHLPAEVEAGEGGKEAAADHQQSSADASDDATAQRAAGGAAAGPSGADAGAGVAGGGEAPRERKRRVRFEDFDEAEDDEAFEQLLQQEAEAGRHGAGGGRGRGARGRRGRPPSRPRAPADVEPAGAATGANVLALGSRGGAAAGLQPGAAQGFGGSGVLLNPAEPHQANHGLVLPGGGNLSLLQHQLQLQRQQFEQQQQQQ